MVLSLELLYRLSDRELGDDGFMNMLFAWELFQKNATVQHMQLFCV